ncbi:MAG: dissimilatory-type sulfite reductase subunit beta, partial [Cocleimonas sp.]
MAAPEMREPIESGCPDGFQYMHPVMRRNFGLWDYHEDVQPGVMVHIAKNGDKVWTVKAGTQRILDVFTLRDLMDIADEYADSYVRFTIRSNIEFYTDTEAKVQPLVEALKEKGYAVGGTRNSVASISHTQGWLHCDIPGTDASGVVKSMMDELYDEFTNWNMPNRVHITTSCCQINCGGQGDIAINVQHTKPPKID